MAKKKENKQVKVAAKPKVSQIKKDFESGITNLRYLAAKHKVELKEVINQIK